MSPDKHNDGMNIFPFLFLFKRHKLIKLAPAPAYRETEMPQAMPSTPIIIEPDHAYVQRQQDQTHIQPDHAYAQPVQPDHASPQPTQTPIHTQQLPLQQPVNSQYPTATPLHALQSSPAPVDCPACGQREMTQVIMESGNTTHAWAAILCFCCCLGCLPYLASSLKDANHHCAKCGVLLATWHNSGKVEVVHGRQRQAQAKKEKK